MALSTAVLSWCTGRYLSLAWLRWLVFGWCLALLDLLTIAACLSGPISSDFAFVLISAQISVIVVWTILANVDWQWRLPGVAIAAALVIVFAANFVSEWSMLSWGLLLILSATASVIVCGGLRWMGFLLYNVADTTSAARQPTSSQANQFGIKHMLIWSAAAAPLLLVVRGIDLLVFADLDGTAAFHATCLSIALAATNLISIWAVLGSGFLVARMAGVLALPIVFAIGLERYADQIRPPLGVPWPRSPIIHLIINMEDRWIGWFWLDAALLAALLLFLRASGYRLMRTPRW
jgi:hypothetical protein